MEIIKYLPNNSEIVQCVKVLQEGGILVLPSDTVYGLCVDATNPEAVKKLIEFKRRPPGKAISIFVESLKSSKKYVEANDTQTKMLSSLVPGPFTIVLQSRHKVVNLLESEKGTLGIRIIDYPLIKEILHAFAKPITATSANIGGTSPHYQIDTFLKSLPVKKREMIDLIVDAGKLPHNKPSTVIDLTAPEIKIIRKGDIKTNDSHVFISESSRETDKLGKFILEKNLQVGEKPYVFLFQGELGAGKTRMIKSMSEALGITNVVSPTYVGYYEYPIQNHKLKMMYHLDLYNIQRDEDLRDLHIERLLKPNTILFIEWIEKGEKILNEIRDKSNATVISIEYTGEQTRKIEISSLTKL